MILSVRKEIRVLFHVFTLPTHCYFSQTHFSSNLIRQISLRFICLNLSIFYIISLHSKNTSLITQLESCIKIHLEELFSTETCHLSAIAPKLQFNSIRGGKSDEIEGIRSSSRSIKSYTLSILHNPLEFPVEIPTRNRINLSPLLLSRSNFRFNLEITDTWKRRFQLSVRSQYTQSGPRGFQPRETTREITHASRVSVIGFLRSMFPSSEVIT